MREKREPASEQSLTAMRLALSSLSHPRTYVSVLTSEMLGQSTYVSGCEREERASLRAVTDCYEAGSLSLSHPRHICVCSNI